MNLRKQDRLYGDHQDEMETLFAARGALIEDLRRQRMGLKAEVQRLQDELAGCTGSDELEQKVAELEAENGRLEDQVLLYRTMARRIQSDLTAAEARIEELLQPTRVVNMHSRPVRVEIGGESREVPPGGSLEVDEAGSLVQIQEA